MRAASPDAVRRDILRGQVSAFIQRAAACGMRSEDIRKSIKAYAELTLELGEIPDLLVRECDRSE